MNSATAARPLLTGTLLLLALSAPGLSRADPPGLYLGAGLGDANVRVGGLGPGAIQDLNRGHFAWKALAGVRPISVVGAELEYLDLGHPNATFGTAASSVQANTQERGAALFAVGYLPLPLPLVDVYGKAGIGRMQTRANSVLPNFPCIGAGCNEFHLQQTDTKFAWGAGVQLQLPVVGLSVRTEYERLNTVNGQPDVMSASLFWSL